mgnify:CR=1 FL=1
MCNCNKSTPIVAASTYYSVQQNISTFDCSKSKGEIEALYEKLKCLKGKIHFKNYNSWKGILDSLLNTKNYCKYSLTPLIELFITYEC